MVQVFKYGRSSVVIDDPLDGLVRGDQSGTFDQRCTLPAGSVALNAALSNNGRMPVAGNTAGFSVVQTVVLTIGAVLFGLGGFLAARGGTQALVIGLVIGAIGLLMAGVSLYSASKRRSRLRILGKAWGNGWLRFAPARVGGVWVTRVSTHNDNGERMNSERRYYYKAMVQAYPTDGTEPFTFRTSEFNAPANWEGRPYNLHMADGPMDVLEPEFTNGWTICRYIAGQPETATISTDLSAKQVKAALEVSQIR